MNTKNQRFISFCRDGQDIEVMTESEYKARGGLPEDWADFIWQFSPDKESAIRTHDDALNAYMTDINERREPLETYSVCDHQYREKLTSPLGVTCIKCGHFVGAWEP